MGQRGHRDGLLESQSPRTSTDRNSRGHSCARTGRTIRVISLIRSRRTNHSAKPFCFRKMIEHMFTTLARIRSFAGARWEGWDGWGNEIPYNAVDDFANSIDVADEAVRERVVYGGPPWAPKASPTRPLRRLRERSAAV